MDVHSAAIKSLMEHIHSNVPEITTILEEFPGPNSTLGYPTVSLVAAEPKLSLRHPELFVYVDKPATIASIDSTYIVADVEIPIQLDLWCMSKGQRRVILQKLINCLFGNPGRSSDLNLYLSTYFNIHANYQINGEIQFQDTNEGTSTSEYRALVQMTCLTSLVATREEYKILHIRLHARIDKNSVSVEEDKQIF